LAAYSYILDAFTAIGIQVVALSTDSLADTQTFQKNQQLTVPLVCELPYPASVDPIGAYRNPPRESHQATAFVLDAEKVVQHAVYSTTNIGRLMPEEVLRVLT
jgi:alkyl hydroperoxide reductase subunit AhpC